MKLYFGAKAKLKEPILHKYAGRINAGTTVVINSFVDNDPFVMVTTHKNNCFWDFMVSKKQLFLINDNQINWIKEGF